MNIEYYHASKYGNGAQVAEEFKKRMTNSGVTVNVSHVRKMKPEQIPSADLYLFSSPGRFGKPLGEMQRFLKKVNLPTGTRYAVIVTEFAPKPTSKEQIPSEEEPGKCQRVIPVMTQILDGNGLIKVVQGKILVRGLKGPLEEGWREKVEDLASQIPILVPSF